MQKLALFKPETQAIFIGEAKAKALKLPIMKVQTLIANLGSAKTQSTQGVVVMKINGTAPPELHVISKKKQNKYQHKQMILHK